MAKTALPHFHDHLLQPGADTIPRHVDVSINWDKWEEPDDADINVLDLYASSSSKISPVDDSSAADTFAAHDLVVLDLAYPWCYRCERMQKALKRVAKMFHNNARRYKKVHRPAFVFADARENIRLRAEYDDSCLGGGCSINIVKAGEPASVVVPTEPITAESLYAEIERYVGPLVADLPSGALDSAPVAAALAKALASSAKADKGLVAIYIDEDDGSDLAADVYDAVFAVAARYRKHFMCVVHHGRRGGGGTHVVAYPKPSRFDDAIDGGRAGLTVTLTPDLISLDAPRETEARLLVAVQPVLQEYSWSLVEAAADLPVPSGLVFVNISGAEINPDRDAQVAHLASLAKHVAAPMRGSLVVKYLDRGQAFMRNVYGLAEANESVAMAIRNSFAADAYVYAREFLELSPDDGAIFPDGDSELAQSMLAFAHEWARGDARRFYTSRELSEYELQLNSVPGHIKILNQAIMWDVVDALTDPDGIVEEAVVMVYSPWHSGAEYAHNVLDRIHDAIVLEGSLEGRLLVGSYDTSENVWDDSTFPGLDESGDAPVVYLYSRSDDGLAIEALLGKETKITARSLWAWLRTSSATIGERWQELVAARKAIVAAQREARLELAKTIASAPKVELAPLDGTPAPETPAYKQVLSAAGSDAPVPPPGAKVAVRYEMRYGDESNVVIESVAMRRTVPPRLFELGQGQQLQCIDVAVATMAAGERAWVWCPPELAYGSAGSDDGRVPPNTPLAFDIELVSFTEPPARSPSSPPRPAGEPESVPRSGSVVRDEL
ncbi:FK506-binding protein 5 [Thecamonas trahens ATCC 50062]|uniref:peptidylprolyl isomerase n=1 Tax=Thecamonas trahens ATCC 50062 TaxID=461836 RepID=A0A0L0DTM9_THETB|nr:FK506-binding protein 5 [Thecamonas trahens ATCC 50062]KNC55416.1 FK506-binding protein 5 [Thecamonas trahens ATCC 50062]|eukprot:XP_013752955.1 FK506-binding protein 5 [Thecamonas trahens ATCC 50062]